MIRSIAPVTQEKHILVICQVADGAGRQLLLLLGVVVEPCLRIKLGDLFLVFDIISGKEFTCSDEPGQYLRPCNIDVSFTVLM